MLLGHSYQSTNTNKIENAANDICLFFEFLGFLLFLFVGYYSNHNLFLGYGQFS